MMAEGADLRRFVAEAIAFFRGVFLAHYAPNLAEIADEPADVLDEWKSCRSRLRPQMCCGSSTNSGTRSSSCGRGGKSG